MCRYVAAAVLLVALPFPGAVSLGKDQRDSDARGSAAGPPPVLAKSLVRDETRPDPGAENGVTIVSLGKPIVSEETFTWRYQIRNRSDNDIWLCDYAGSSSCEVRMADDNETVLVRRRLDLPKGSGLPPLEAFYVRLPKGETRTEVMSFMLPIQPRYVFANPRQGRPLEYATHLALEIEYYADDLPEMLLDIVCHPKVPVDGYPSDQPFEKYDPSFFFPRGILTFLELNQGERKSGSEWVRIPYMWQSLRGEDVLRLEADGLHVPYLDLEQDNNIVHPGLGRCTRVEVKFKPNALDFLFPHVDERALLSSAEQKDLQSLDAIVIEDPKLLTTLAQEFRNRLSNDVFVSERATAQLACYHNEESIASVTIYDDWRVMDEQGQVFSSLEPLASMMSLTSEIQAIDLRIRCAVNMRNLWRRLRLYHIAQYGPGKLMERWEQYRANRQFFLPEAFEDHEKVYPQADRWCDAMSDAYRLLFTDPLVVQRALQCPSRRGGKSSYAMNPHCRYDSPPDMVLLFETKQGWIRRRWNEHGGAELFTFDNHDPKGGCILLNDGTVKFIRTEEELKQLRWK